MIFIHLPAKTIFRLALVCKAWRKIINSKSHTLKIMKSLCLEKWSSELFMSSNQFLG